MSLVESYPFSCIIRIALIHTSASSSIDSFSSQLSSSMSCMSWLMTKATYSNPPSSKSSWSSHTDSIFWRSSLLVYLGESGLFIVYCCLGYLYGFGF